MEMRSLRLLMDINSLQNLGTVQAYTGQNSSSSSLFTSMLEEMLDNQSVSTSLSSISSSLIGNLAASESLHYTGQNGVFKPSSLSTVLATTRQSESLARGNGMRNEQYDGIIKQAANLFDIPEKLIASVIRQESNFNNSVVSHAGAEGLMQLMPGTAKFLGVTDSFDPVQNIMGGTKYLRQMLNQFDGDLELALAAYNAGPGNVKKYGGIPPFTETEQYVQKVLGYFIS